MLNFDNCGEVWIHTLVNTRSKDFFHVKNIALNKASCGSKVHILPILNEGDPRKNLIYDGAFPNKCPDLKIDNHFVEIKTPTLPLTNQKISNNIKRAYDQATHVIINLLEPYSRGKLYNIAKGRFFTHDNLVQIEYNICGTYVCFERDKIIKQK